MHINECIEIAKTTTYKAEISEKGHDTDNFDN